jgi:CTP synthase (UTP-ammonia lyase)
MMFASLRLIILGEYSAASENHRHTDAALAHSAALLGLDIKPTWISTADISDKTLSENDALWVTTGSPYKDMRKALHAIRTAREQGIPCLGTCGGFQHMVIEYARHVLRIEDAQHAEYDPHASHLIVSKLACSLAGRTMVLSLAPDSLAAALYGSLAAEERYYCSFGINPEYVPVLRNNTFRPVGSDAEGEIRVMEISGHPFFIGTLFVPQARSTLAQPHPLVTGFLASALKNSNNDATQKMLQ